MDNLELALVEGRLRTRLRAREHRLDDSLVRADHQLVAHCEERHARARSRLHRTHYAEDARHAPRLQPMAALKPLAAVRAAPLHRITLVSNVTRAR